MRQRVGGLLLVVMSIGFLPAAAGASILINEVLADPAADANGDGSLHSIQDEFIELVNTASNPISLANWSFSDLVQVRHVFSAGATIPGNGFFVVFGGGAPSGFTDVALASTGTLSLNNSGDTITLLDADGLLIDALTYGSEGGLDVSLTRSPDGSGPFVPHSSVSSLAFSPGTTVDGFDRLNSPPIEEEPGSALDPNGSPIVPEPSTFLLIGMGVLGLALPPGRFA